MPGKLAVYAISGASVFVTLAAGPLAAAGQDTAYLVSEDPLRAPDVPLRSHRYGPDRGHYLRFSRPPTAAPPPVVILIGDQGWRPEAGPYTMHLLRSALWERGYAFAAIDYRLRGSPDVETSIANVVLALNWLIANAVDLSFDRQRVVLMGNGPGGYIVTLLGTDPQTYLAAEVSASIKGIVSVNGESFDVAQRMREVSPFRRGILREAFGEDRARQVRLSPARHVGPPNAPAFLFQAVSDRPELQEQALQMRNLLKQAGTRAAYAPLAPWVRDVSNTYYGGQGSLGMLHLLEFLSATVGPAN